VVDESTVLAYFLELNVSKKIPKKVVSIVQARSPSVFRGPALLKPTQIIKKGSSTVTGLDSYLVDMGGVVQWYEVALVQADDGFKEVLNEWYRQIEIRHDKALLLEDGAALEWLRIDQLKLMKSDRDMIINGGPLNHVVMDAAMTVLANQTAGFVMKSCLSPLVGRGHVVAGRHYQVHYGGRGCAHFSSSLKVDGAVFYIDYSQTSSISAPIAAELMDMYHDDEEELVVRMLRLPKQEREATCGLLQLAALVTLCLPVLEHHPDPCDLTTTKFDEDEAPKWLVSCLEKKLFTKCPSSVIAGPKPSFDEKALSPTGVLGGSYPRASQLIGRADTHIGYGPTSTTEHQPSASDRTAVGQTGRRRIVEGCVIRYRNSTDLVVVRPICKKQNALTTESVSSVWNGATGEGPDAHIKQTGVDFIIVGPPSFRCLEYRYLHEYDVEVSAKRAVMFIYPIRRGLLSNSLFMSNAALKYLIIETERCESRFDVESLLLVISGRTVNFQVRLEDVFPVRSLVSYFEYRPDVRDLRELHTVIARSLLEDSQVTLETDPFAPQRATKYPTALITPGDLPPFVRIVRDVNLGRSAGMKEPIKLKPCKVVIPVLGLECEFSSSTATTVDMVNWVRLTVGRELRGARDGTAIANNVNFDIHPYVDSADCLSCYVVESEIVKFSAGYRLNAEDRKQLERSVEKMVKALNGVWGVSNPQLNNDDDWRYLGRSKWGRYCVRVHMSAGVAKVVDVVGCNSVYEVDIAGISSNVEIGGFLNVGGHN
jgi:hypothetical protein